MKSAVVEHLDPDFDSVAVTWTDAHLNPIPTQTMTLQPGEERAPRFSVFRIPGDAHCPGH